MSDRETSPAAWLDGNQVVPVVVIQEAADAAPLCDALARGGIGCVEITLRTAAGLSAIEKAAGRDDFLVGAGTVLNAGQARDAIAAGAQFLVSPGFDDGVVDAGRQAGVPVVPGIVTASEAQRAVNAGVRLVKFFPAATSGGPAAVTALSAPFQQLLFVPTGGISQQDAPTWLAIEAVVAVGGSWLAPPAMLRERRFDHIEQIARDTVGSLTATAGAR